MACKRSAVRSRLAPPFSGSASPSSRGLGHCPFTAATGVRIPLGTPFEGRQVPRARGTYPDRTTLRLGLTVRTRAPARLCPGELARSVPKGDGLDAEFHHCWFHIPVRRNRGNGLPHDTRRPWCSRGVRSRYEQVATDCDSIGARSIAWSARKDQQDTGSQVLRHSA